MSETKLNVLLLRKIQKHILEEPRRFQMGAPIIQAKNQTHWDCARTTSRDASRSMPPCGTAACIAGWADLFTGGDGYGKVRDRAAIALGIDAGSSWNGHPLFYADSWFEPFRARYHKAKTPKARAKIAAARIDYLIKEGK